MKRSYWIALFMGPALIASAWAQVPGIPTAPGIPAAPAAPAAAAPRNIWSFFTRTPEQKAAHKDCFCNSPLGKMATSAIGPISAFSGGLIGQDRCAQKAIEDILSDPAKEGSAEAVAAGIKKSEAEAKARRAAVRFLGTVDCSRFPDAEGVLIKSLLEDTNECVRYEAALALQSGCCCTKKVVKALTDCISGKSPVPESSERVKTAAAEALSRCEVAVTPTEIDLKKQDELKKVELSPADYHKRVSQLTRAEVIEEARQVLADYRTQPAAGAPALPAGYQRPTSVAAILSNAFSGPRGMDAVAVETAPPSTVAQPGAESPAEPRVMNAVLTSHAKGPAAAAAEVPYSVQTERRPFFSNITRALKGKQTGRMMMAAPVVAAPVATAPVATAPVATAPVAAPVAPVELSGPNSVAPLTPQAPPEAPATPQVLVITPEGQPQPEPATPTVSDPTLLPPLAVPAPQGSQESAPMLPGFPSQPPAQEPPAQEPPAQEPPVQEPTIQEPPVQEPPAQAPPVQAPPRL
ncbi:MAG: hypothetical protein L0Y71_00890 [Gemmataceae bacterium]|nr:hypothetical protein [Gemmataceae bacterium]